MAKRTTLNIKCERCGKVGHEQSRSEFDGEIWIELTCGHTIIKQALDTMDVSITSSDGRTPFPFQMVTAKFMEDADCNGLILHEQGLGKTVIECLLLKRNKELLPALIVVKSGLRAQWFQEVFRWTGMLAQVITSSREKPLFDLFDIIIVSIDTLRRLRPDVAIQSLKESLKSDIKTDEEKKKGKDVVWTDEICSKFKHICVDESQHIKNPGSARTQALRKIVQAANDGNKARVICMSGTNIEKHAGEYFVTLNMVRPELFPQQATYIQQHVDCDANGKLSGLKNPARFRQMTEDFIIRYTRDQVLPDLPKVFRQFRLAEMEGGELKAYLAVVKEFQQRMDDPETPMLPTDILGFLSKMRHITGIAKVKAAVQFVEEFLLESERKLVVFLHHKQAAAILDAKLTKLCWTGDSDLALSEQEVPRLATPMFSLPLQLHSALTLNERTHVVEQFMKPENRILIASTLAAGEGLNMQFCSDCLIMERQWNPSKEEQAEGRFPRPGSTADKINAHYLIAAGTIDDFLTEIVEKKRRNVAQTLDGKETVWEEASLMSELAETLRVKGLRKWGF